MFLPKNHHFYCKLDQAKAALHACWYVSVSLHIRHGVSCFSADDSLQVCGEPFGSRSPQEQSHTSFYAIRRLCLLFIIMQSSLFSALAIVVFVIQLVVGIPLMRSKKRSWIYYVLLLAPIWGILAAYFISKKDPRHPELPYWAYDRILPPSITEQLTTMVFKVVDFRGRARRQEWAFAVTWYFVTPIVLMFIWSILINFLEDIDRTILTIVLIIWLLVLFACALGLVAVTVRRLHDIGESGWLIFLPMSFPFGFIFLLFSDILLLVFDSEKEANEYGPSSKYVRKENLDSPNTDNMVLGLPQQYGTGLGAIQNPASLQHQR